MDNDTHPPTYSLRTPTRHIRETYPHDISTTHSHTNYFHHAFMDMKEGKSAEESFRMTKREA